MRVKSVELHDFRNFKELCLELCPGVNVVSGDNAQGKTNFLESLSLLSNARSFRTRLDRELIRFDKGAAFLKCVVQARGRDFTIEMRIAQGIRKKITINGVTAAAGELPGVFSTVCFCPEDLDLIRGGSSRRRRFLDGAISTLRPKYADAVLEYGRLQEHKTRILRDSLEKPDLSGVLPEFELRMAQVGAVIIRHRAHYVEKLKKFADTAHGELTDGKERLELQYETVSTVRDPLGGNKEIFEDIMEHQDKHRTAEAASGLCLTGPHKDGLGVLIDGLSAKNYGSQGQTRTAALSLKLAELEICREELGEYPVLLLDDVLSELDEARRRAVLTKIEGGQVIISCCAGDAAVPAGLTINIKNGEIV